MVNNLRKKLLKIPPITPEEKARRRRAQQRLKERLSSIPFYAEKDDAFWRTFQASRMLANG